MAHSHSESNRREFLSGRSMVRAVVDLAPGESAAAIASSRDAFDTYLVRVSRDAMATEFEILLNAGEHTGATEAAVAALDLVDDLETQMTVYRASSEVLSINRLAAQEPVVVERRLFALLARAKVLHASTEGAFDITSGPLSKAWGFFQRNGQFPDEAMLAHVKSLVGSQWLELDAPAGTIRFARPGIEINLNAIGKGYALDRAAELLAERDVRNFLIHGGRSSILARGSRAVDESHGRGWLVAVKHPFRPNVRLAEVWLRDRALGTSGSGNQFFHFQGKRYGHVINPKTGYPADHVLSATVLAPDAATADALSTALFVIGVDDARPFCAAHPEIAAIFVCAGEREGEVELHTIGLRSDEWQSGAQRIVVDEQ